MIHLNGQANANDIEHIIRTTGISEEDIVVAEPCPISDYDAETNEGKINPHVTRFTFRDGQKASVFHIKPIYYETTDGQWRPMEEVTHGFGNTWIDFRADWQDKIHPRYMSWLIKRAQLFSHSDLKIPTPYGVPITVEQRELIYS
jgi:hypothetical protein